MLVHVGFDAALAQGHRQCQAADAATDDRNSKCLGHGLTLQVDAEVMLHGGLEAEELARVDEVLDVTVLGIVFSPVVDVSKTGAALAVSR